MTLDPGAVALAEAAARWRSAYVHIPFCHRVCPYCDFAVVAGRTDLADRYVEAVVDEILRDEGMGSLDAVFVGGGTPSTLEPRALGRILDALSRTHGIAAGAEITTEANPEDWTKAYCDGVAAVGFTRVSLGAQSFDPEVLANLGRLHSPQQAAAAISVAKGSAFASINVDLIFGTPGETTDSWAATVDTTLRMEVDHLSTYALTVERGTPLSRAVADGAPAPDEDDQADKWHIADEAAAAAGLIRYEVSNAARPGHECRYNLATWGQADYAGYGLGAHGHRAGVRTRNTRRLDAYLAAVESGAGPRLGREVASAGDQEIERLMLGLRRRVGVEVGPGGRRLLASGVGERLVAAGIVKEQDGRLVVAKPLLTDTVIRAVMESAET